MSQDSSHQAMIDATRSRAKFSGHGRAKGAAGYKGDDCATMECDFLDEGGQSLSLDKPKKGFPDIKIGLEWDQIIVEKKVLGLFKTQVKKDVDLDLGCFYELQNGSRGVLQAFGDIRGSYDSPPYIILSRDEREGDEEGDDEHLIVNGQKWDNIKRIILYVYIYEGVPHWGQLKPKIHVRIPDQNPMTVTLQAAKDEFDICVLAGIENVRGGLKLTNYTEYYPGQAEMDRAFGFGLEWEDGEKKP